MWDILFDTSSQRHVQEGEVSYAARHKKDMILSDIREAQK